jgi:hypothetical protein
MTRRIIILVPFLFTLASLLQLNYVALIVTSPVQLIRPLLVLWLVLIVLSSILYFLLRDPVWVSLLLTIFVAGVYFSASLFALVLVLVAILGAVWFIVLRLLRQKPQISQAAFLLTCVSLLLVGYAGFSLIQSLARVPWKHYRNAVSQVRSYSLPAMAANTPDIYFIVLDGYARADLLQELYGFDNSQFLEELAQRGFVVPPASVSNYPATHLSLASMLNMDYVSAFAPGLEGNYQRWLMSPFIDYSRVRAALEGQGYTTVSISTNWSITDNPTTDFYFQSYPVVLSDFEGFLFNHTPLRYLGPALDRFVASPSFTTHRQTILYNIETLMHLDQVPAPRFIVAHIIAPHPPFVFDRQGRAVEPPFSFSYQDADGYYGTREEYRQGYVEQLQFLNDRILEVVDAILTNSSSPPVIILQADHGPGLLVSFRSPQATCVRERFSTFAAYSLPDVDPEKIPSDMAAVNVFRLILNEYFDAGLPLLESRQYFYKQPVSFYEFENVTDRVSEGCEVPGSP